MHYKTLAVAALLVVSTVGATGLVTANDSHSTTAYSGTHVSFRTDSNAVTDYSVHDETVVRSVAVQSSEAVSADGGLDASLDTSVLTDFVGAAVSLETTTQTSATVRAESGATLTAHDNDRGVLVVEADDSGQVVKAAISAEAEGAQSTDDSVVVQSGDDVTGTFIVVGEGNVTVDESGNVTARLKDGSRLVYRQYQGDRTQDERKQERLIANGTAAAEVYVQSAASSANDSSADGTQRTVDIVRYSENTAVDVTQTTENRVEITAERAESEGRVIIATVSETADDSAEDVTVTVDGEAAARADSYAAVRQATDGGDTSRYLVRQSSSAEASYDVIVGVNHFSERHISIQDATDSRSDQQSTSTKQDANTESSDDADNQPSSSTGGSGPGFGVGSAIISLLGAILVTSYRG